SHDFDRDILSAARNIMKRYAGHKPHTDKLLEVSDEIFRAVRKSNLLSDRDRLLLKVACYLHDCGKYVSLVDVAACSYNIIKSTEIIGLSDRERMIIANVVRYNTVPLDFRGNPAYEGQARDMLPEDLIRVAKLTAILRLANGLDQSYLQKITEIRATRKEEKLIIEVVVKEDFTLEKGIFEENITFFEDIFDVKPVLKIKKKIS
ncbi:MAG: HD domain-containing protein, partial [Lachnospiraceae bacterium]|nr:HD domain-containing protein [Lachnospiraceae bacterium]